MHFSKDESDIIFSPLSFSLTKMQYKDGKGRAGVLILEQLTEYNGGYNTRPVIVQSKFLIHHRTECLTMMIEKLVLTKVSASKKEPAISQTQVKQVDYHFN